MFNGGEGGIRTHGKLAPTPVFKTGAFNHSATSPHWGLYMRIEPFGARANERLCRLLRAFIKGFFFESRFGRIFTGFNPINQASQ